LAGLDGITGDVVRMVVRAKMFPMEAFDRLKAIYETDALLNRELDGYSQDAAGGFTGYQPGPGNQRTVVGQLLTTSPTCIYAQVVRDYSAVGVRGATDSTEWVAIRPLQSARDPHGYNRTGWAYKYEGFTQQRTQPATNPCAA
jgi:hypothetical protein